MDFEQIYEHLNPEQKKAVDTINGPVMVLAGPGTGKTQLLSVRTANILRHMDFYPSNIMILTYTNAGVKAMRERLAQLIGADAYDVIVETFHGFANTLITDSEEAASIKGDRIEMTDLERINLLEYLLDHLDDIRPIRNPNAPYLYRNDIQVNMSMLKRDGITPEDLATFLQTYQPDDKFIEKKHLQRLYAFSKIYSAYEEAKTPEGNIPIFDKRGRYDFDDMILLATETLRQETDLLAKYQEQFQYIMIDEFQDTNGAQLKLMRTLFPDHHSNVCVVGDDDQSIYRFQGASVGNFHIFEKLFNDPEKIILTRHYRSNPYILKTSSDIIRQIPDDERIMDKQLISEKDTKNKFCVSSQQFGTVAEELSFLVQEIQRLDEKTRNNTAILVRTRRQAQDVIAAFLQSGIPYSTDGKEDIRGEFRIQQLIKVLDLSMSALDFEKKDLLLFELLLSDFWKIEHRDLMSFAAFVNKRKRDFFRKRKRQINKSPKEYRLEESQEIMDFEVEKIGLFSQYAPSLFTEFLLRFPAPSRISVEDHKPPTQEETAQLSICSDLNLLNPNRLHHAAWVIRRLIQKAPHHPIYSLMMEFLQDSGLLDFILKHYQNNEVIRLRELRSIGSFVENLKKAHKANPGLITAEYVLALAQLEKHSIPLRGEMVSSSQKGVKILTAHSSKGLEFEQVFIPFCIQNKSWPKRAITNKIPLPHKLLIGQEQVRDREVEKQLHQYDENRLFYVAASRAKSRLVFTAAPQDKQIFSQFLTTAGLVPSGLTVISEEQLLINLLTKEPQIDPIASSRQVLKALVEDLTLSPSSINTYIRCKRQFLYHNVLRAPQPKSQALIYGQCVHKALEKSYRRYMNEDQLPPLQYFEDQFLQELDWQGADQSVRQGCLHHLDDAKEWYQNVLDQGTVKPYELERKVTRRLDSGIIFTGQFDKIELLGKSGEARVIDYKTGTPDKHVKSIDNCNNISSGDCDDYLRQLIAYKLLYEKGHHSLQITSGQLVFVDSAKSTVKKYGLKKGEFVNKTVELTPGMLKQYENLLQEIWCQIKDMRFDRLENYDKKKCSYCPYQRICWK